MRKGDRVLFTAMWSTFYGMRGVIKQMTPHIMVRIDNDAYDIRVGAKEIVLDEPPVAHIGGAE